MFYLLAPDLKEEIKDSFRETIISSFHWRLSKIDNRLSAIHRIEKEDYKFTDALMEKMKRTSIARFQNLLLRNSKQFQR
jgi:hypothetical protein